MKILKRLALITTLLIVFASTCLSSALQVDFLLNGYRHPTSDAILSGGKVYTYLDGTSTLSALYTDKDEIGTATNPIILDSAGKAEVFGNTIYKFVIYDSDDNLIETLNGLEYKTQESFVSDTAYDKTTWNGVTTIAPSKNAVRDQFQVILESFKAEGPVDSNDFQVQWSKGADVASAAALPILTDGNSFDVTGTNAITSIATTGRVGTWIMIQFDGILTFTHHATDLILPGGANITTAAGDLALCYEYASGDYRVFYQKADGSAVVRADNITQGTAVESTSGTAIDFTSIPAGTNRIFMSFVGVSTNGTNDWVVQMGDSGGFETTGYTGATFTAANSLWSSGAKCVYNPVAASVRSGHVILERFDGNTWTISVQLGRSAASAEASEGAGHKTLTGELDRVRFTTDGGTDTFDLGEVNISYER